MALVIREIERPDLPFVIDLLNKMSFVDPANIDLDLSWDSYLKSHNLYSVVAEYDNKVVGYMRIVMQTKLRGGTAGHLEDQIVDDAYRGKNIGKALMQHLIDFAKKNNFYKLNLLCFDDIKPFHEKFGFEAKHHGMTLYLKD